MSKRILVIGCLVLLVLSLTSCSFNPIDTKIKEIQEKENDMSDIDIQTYTFTDKVLMFAGLYEIEPPSGSNPSFLIKNSTGSNMFEIDHDGRGRVMGNFTVGDNIVLNNSRFYTNASGCSIWESDDGSKMVLGCS